MRLKKRKNWSRILCSIVPWLFLNSPLLGQTNLVSCPPTNSYDELTKEFSAIRGATPDSGKKAKVTKTSETKAPATPKPDIDEILANLTATDLNDTNAL